MTPERIAELRRQAESVRGLPWMVAGGNRIVAPKEHQRGFPGATLRIGETFGDMMNGPSDPNALNAAAYIVAACNALPELLDELTRGKCEECGEPAYCALFWGDKPDYPLCVGHFKAYIAKLNGDTGLIYNKLSAETARADLLAAQVAMLRGLLEPTDDVWEHNIDEDGCHRRGKCERCEARRIALADTETATTAWLEAHDREQRLAGAREAMRELRHLLAEHVGSDFRHSRIKDSYDADVTAVLEAMEREE